MRFFLLFSILLACGLSTLQASSVLAATWQPGPDASSDNTYAGFVDQPAVGAQVASDQPLVVAGWFVDQTADGWAGVDDVQVYDGLSGAGGRFLGRGQVGLNRPDVAQALGNGFWLRSGFSASLGPLGPGVHTLSVYAHTPAKGWWFTQVPITVLPPAASPPPPPLNALVAPTGSERVSRKLDSFTIRGFALDPAATTGTGIDRVQVYMDEPRFQGGTFVGEAQFGGSTPSAAAQFGPHFSEAGYRIDIRPSDFTAGNHHVYIYARSSVSGLETQAVASFDMFNP
jgi:hypothetical protein